MGIWIGLISSITLLVASVANADTEDATGSGTTVFFGEDAPERYGLQDLTHSYNFLNRDDWVDNPNLNRLGLDGLPAVGALMEEMPGHHEVYGLVQVATSWEGVNRDSGGSDTTSIRLDNNTSILGVRGWVGNEVLKGIYNAQFGIDYDNNPVLTRRDTYIGLKHSEWGTVVLGTTSPPYKAVAARDDPFRDTAAGFVFGAQSYAFPTSP